ncbi:MAG TPA: helix-turn-helix domain-containing protein [Flavobacterium sp.]|jgi:transcriptional regulator with XRE-family HTH domain
MSIFSDNLRYLRESRKESQRETSESLEIKRGRYEPYESGKVEPPYEILKKISLYFGVSIDFLLTIDLRKYRREDMVKLDDNRIILPITVDKKGNNLIEVVPHKARAGYLTGYADPEFIEGLQQFSLPFLGSGKMRAFPIGGDSMPPHNDKAFIVGRYVENLGEVTSGKTYILVTLSEGITYKRLSEKTKDAVRVESDNLIYSPYAIKLSDILEIWEYVCHIGRDDSKPQMTEDGNVREMFLELKRDIDAVKRKIAST